jgi:hypothetical protein
VLAIAYTTITVVSLFAFARHQFTRTIPETVRSIEVHNSAGSVHVIVGERADVVVEGKGVRGLSHPTHHEAVAAGRLSVDAHCGASFLSLCTMNLTLHVPPGVPVTLRSSGGGITVDGATAFVDASSSGGGVHVNGASGELRLDSSGGGVTATGLRSSAVTASSSGGGVHLTFAASPTNVHASSSGGGVTIDLPHNSDAYKVDAGSSGGGTHVDVRTDPDGDRTIYAHSSGGSVHVQYGT